MGTTTAAQPASFWNTSVDWISSNTKALSASAGELGSRVWTAVKDCFSWLGQIFCQLGNTISDAFVAAKDTWVALPSNVKWLAVVTGGASLVAGAVVGRCFSSNTPATPAPAAAAAAAAPAAPAAGAANPPAATQTA